MLVPRVGTRRPLAELLEQTNMASQRADQVLLSYVLAIIGLPFLFVLCVVVSLCNWWTGDPGHLFFVQERYGRNMKPFRMIKLRTMYAAGGHDHFALPHDERVTRVGCVLRRFHLDEFPQIINILQLQMLIVGPRPYATAELAIGIDRLYARHPGRAKVLPGITGAAYVDHVCPDTDTDEAYLDHTDRHFVIDERYVAGWHLWVDLVIMTQTVRDIVTALIAHLRHTHVAEALDQPLQS